VQSTVKHLTRKWILDLLWRVKDIIFIVIFYFHLIEDGFDWIGPIRPTEDPAGLPYKLSRRDDQSETWIRIILQKNYFLRE
jgi:hypothetical protein